MSKPMNYAAEKSGAQCNGMGAKRDPESTHAKVRQSAFSGLGDEAELLSATRTARAPHEAPSELPDSDDCPDSADRQCRNAKARVLPSLDEVKARIIAARHSGPTRPLMHLARVEDELHAQSAALNKLSSPQQKPRDKNLLVHQLTRTVDTSRVAKTIAPQLRDGAVALYSALQSEDPTDSILNRLTLGMLNSVMECHARAAETSNLKALDTYHRHVVKGTKSIIDLVEARERRRSPKQITVGQVNVEAGGQAIVGNVEAPKQRRPEKGIRAEPSLDTDEETDD